MARSLMPQVLALYGSASRTERLHMQIRHQLCPFERIAAWVPAQGLVVDLGCGHALFPALLALESADRQILGVEPSVDKIRTAAQATAHLPNLQLVIGDALGIPACGCQAITILDVAYLMPPQEQAALVSRCCEALAPGGVLLLKDVDTRPRLKFAVCYVEEWLVGRLLAHATGEQFHVQPVQSFHFHCAAEWADAMRLAGFERVQAIRLDRGYYHPHLLVIGQKGHP